jgi:hypothetical protein
MPMKRPRHLPTAFFVLAMGLFLGGTATVEVHTAWADPYFNSTEPGCDGSDSNVLMCDDFEDGTWYEENADVANNNGGIDVRTDGWAGRIRDGYPHATCGSGVGAGGTNCAARSILHGGDGGNSALADHNLAPGQGPGVGSSYDEVYFRFYLKVLSGYNWNNNQKFVTWNPCCANDGGIVFGGGPTRNNLLMACPFWDCNLDDNYRNPQNGCNSWFLCQNQGNTFDLADHVNHWVFIEVHVKLNTAGVRNGIYQMWVDDCGTNGLGCSGNPTLRMNYTNIGFRCTTSYNSACATGQNAKIGVIFFDIWGNPADVGTMLLDQVKVAKVGPIGFMGSIAPSPPPEAPPAAPTALQVR